MLKAFVTLLFAAVGLLILLSALLAWMEPRMIFYPHRALEATPAARGWRFDDVWLEAGDGVRIHGWFIPAPAERRGRTTVLFLHGNAGNISHRFEKLALLRSLGADVLIVDYRGYGRSEGRPSEAGLHRDARAAYQHLIGTRRVEPDAIVLYGESLGTAVASRLGAEALVAGLVLEAAFTSVADVGQSMFPFLPVRWLVRNRFDNLRWIARVRAPILVIHSRDDEYFPPRHAQRLVEAAGPRAELVLLSGGHNQAFLVSAELYGQALKDFLARAVRPRS